MTNGFGLERAKGTLEDYRRRMQDDGFIVIEGAVEAAPLEELARSMLSRFSTERSEGRIFNGGGVVSGHLNCFPGRGSRFVYEALETKGIFDIVRELSTAPVKRPNVGCNLNLPGSHAQNEHIDGYAATPFIVVNVAAVDTDLRNGAIEVLPGTQQRSYKYWEIALGRSRRKRLPMKQGDALLRISTLWHRGMPNRAAEPRPMLAFSWEDGGTDAPDPYAVHGGEVTFLPNRFRTDWRGRLMERAFVTAPGLGKTYQVARSLLVR